MSKKLWRRGKGVEEEGEKKREKGRKRERLKERERKGIRRGGDGGEGRRGRARESKRDPQCVDVLSYSEE